MNVPNGFNWELFDVRAFGSGFALVMSLAGLAVATALLWRWWQRRRRAAATAVATREARQQRRRELEDLTCYMAYSEIVRFMKEHPNAPQNPYHPFYCGKGAILVLEPLRIVREVFQGAHEAMAGQDISQMPRAALLLLVEARITERITDGVLVRRSA
jgi:hypothetical protein